MIRSNRWPLAIACLGLGLMGGLAASQRLIGQPPVEPAVPAPAVPPLVQAPVNNQPVFPRDWMSFGPVVKKVLPAVVCLESKGKGAKANLDDIDPGFGSGFIVDPTGVICTNNHVVRDTAVVEISLLDGRKFTSRDIRRDPKADIAIIKVETKELLPALEFGDSAAMEVGDQVLAVGAPFGLTGSVTHGIVSGKSRNNLNLNLYEDFIQTDAAVNPGNSGGPLINMEGKVIGLTAAIKTRSGGFQGVGLAVSSKLAKTVTEQLVKNGFVRRPYIGVSVVEMDDATAARQKVKAGVMVSDVSKPSPGSKANLGVGDVITSVNNQPITTVRELQKAVLGLPIGQAVDLLVVRKGQLFLTKIAAEEQPDNMGVAVAPGAAPAGPTISFEGLGLTVTDLTPDMAAKLGLPKIAQGVVVNSVTAGGLAAQSGLARGMIVLQVDKTPVPTAEVFRRAVEQASKEKGAVLHVLQPTGAIDYVVLKGE
jgi:serine protease Do